MQEVEKLFNKAKVAMMSRPSSTFLSTILFSLDFSWNTDIPTACTDGLRLFINPNWYADMSDDARVGLLAHEAWHVAFNHIVRGKDLDKQRYNKAADYVINNMLLDQKYELPENGLWDPIYKDMSTEQVYALLPVSDPSDPYDCDISVANGDIDETAIETIIMKAAMQSAANGDKAGTIPGEIEIFIKNKTNPILPWNVILQNYMSAYAKDDYSYKIPNRKYFPELYLPSMYSESITNIAVAIDTSGSVRDEEFDAFLSEVEDIRINLKPVLTTLIGFDTRINTEILLTESDSIEDIKFTGRGGTSLSPVFNYFETKPPTVLIVFSDLDCSKITKEPDYDVIWVCVNNPNATVDFGSLIHLKI